MEIAVLAKLVVILVFTEALSEAAAAEPMCKTFVELVVSHLGLAAESKGAAVYMVTAQMSFAAASWNSLTSSSSNKDEVPNCLFKRRIYPDGMIRYPGMGKS